jgi:hypothetical protein
MERAMRSGKQKANTLRLKQKGECRSSWIESSVVFGFVCLFVRLFKKIDMSSSPLVFFSSPEQ